MNCLVMNKSAWLGGVLISAGLLLASCSDSAFKLSEQERAAFRDAAPEMKQTWENGLKAEKANDYLTASTNFRALLSKQITPDQLVAVQTALGALNYRINEAAAKGDAAAQKAVEALKAGAPRR